MTSHFNALHLDSMAIMSQLAICLLSGIGHARLVSELAMATSPRPISVERADGYSFAVTQNPLVKVENLILG